MSSGPDVELASATGSGTESASSPAGPGSGRRGGWWAAGLFAVAQAVFFGVLRLWQPRFFFIDDKVLQYLPVWHWLGQHASWSGVPLVDPDQGSGGAFAADLQYGVLDPFHWALAAVLGRMDGLNAAGWGLQILGVYVLGLGIVLLCRRLGASPAWAALAALGAANSGFLLWFGGSWWPAVWGTALLPWLWWALIGRTRWAVPVAAVAAYLLVTSGYPYTLPFAGVVVVGVLAERIRHRRDWRLWRDRPLVTRVLGAAAGLLLGLPGILTASAMTKVSARAAAVLVPQGNSGYFIPNLADVLIGGPTTSPEAFGWWNTIMPSAAAATGWFVLPVLALVRWRRVREFGLGRIEGVLTGGLLVLVAVVATQLPTDVGSFRLPMRYMLEVGVFAPVVVAVLASAVGLSFTRGRLLAAGGLVVLQTALAVFRYPALVGWHLAALALGLAALAGLAFTWRRARTASLAVLLAATLVAPLVSVAAAVGARNVEADAAGLPRTGTPDHGMWDAGVWPASVGAIRARAVQPNLNATVIVWSGEADDRGLSTGVPVGSSPLYSGMRTSFGYSSVGQAGWIAHTCQDFLGEIGGGGPGTMTGVDCSNPVANLLAPAPGTGLDWLELLSKNTLLLDDRTPPQVAQSLAGRWRLVGPEGGFQRYERITPTVGRITWTSAGVSGLRAVTVGTDSERYDVRWSGDTARLVTRIPWWPGYRATLDGKPLAVQVVDRAVVAVDLPRGGGSGQLRIFFVPPHHRIGLAAVVLGALVGVAAVGIELFRRPGRFRPGSARRH